MTPHEGEDEIAARELHDRPLDGLVRRGLVTAPAKARRPKRPRVHPKQPVSDLVAEQRR